MSLECEAFQDEMKPSFLRRFFLGKREKTERKCREGRDIFPA